MYTVKIQDFIVAFSRILRTSTISFVLFGVWWCSAVAGRKFVDVRSFVRCDVTTVRCVCWCVGVLVCWCVGVLVCWCVGVLVCSSFRLLVCWCVRLFGGWCVGVLVCSSVDAFVGVVGVFVGVLVCWCVGVLVCWCCDFLVGWFVGSLVCRFVGLFVCSSVRLFVAALRRRVSAASVGDVVRPKLKRQIPSR